MSGRRLVLECETADSRQDSGITMVEVAVSAAVMTLVMSIFTTGILQIYATVNKVESLSASQSQLMVAFRRLDREVRYASAISDPATAGTGAGAGIYVEYLTAVTDPVGGDDTAACVQLRLSASSKKLERRSWPEDESLSTSAAWTVLVTGAASTTPFVVTRPGVSGNAPSLQISLTVTSGTGATAVARGSKAVFAALNGSVDTDDPSVCIEGRTKP